MQPQHVVPPAEDKAVNGQLCPILPQRGVNGSQEVTLGICGHARGCLLTSHSRSHQEHPLLGMEEAVQPSLHSLQQREGNGRQERLSGWW